MKKILLLLAVSIGVLLACAWYLHASIYWALGKTHLSPPRDFAEYVVGTNSVSHLTYVAIGDSLTAGVGVETYVQSYPYLLAQKIAGTTTKVLLKPFAVPGVRSGYVLDNVTEPVIASKPDIITLLIGINDIHGNVSPQQFEDSYAKILARLTVGTHARIYAINLPSIGTSDLISFPYRYYFNWRAEQFNEIIQRLALQYHVTYIDLHTPHELHGLDNLYYARDFFHPNAIGYTLWAQFIYAGFHT